MSVFDEDKNLDSQLLEEFCSNFRVDYRRHIKTGFDCMGNIVNIGDPVFVIDTTSQTKSRLIPGVVVRHTDKKTHVLTCFSEKKSRYKRNKQTLSWEQTEPKDVHLSFYPEQIIKTDIEKMIALRNAINKVE